MERRAITYGGWVETLLTWLHYIHAQYYVVTSQGKERNQMSNERGRKSPPPN